MVKVRKRGVTFEFPLHDVRGGKKYKYKPGDNFITENAARVQARYYRDYGEREWLAFVKTVSVRVKDKGGKTMWKQLFVVYRRKK